MNVSRRQFIGLSMGLGLSCALGMSTESFAVGKATIRFAAINDLHILDAKSVGIVERAVAQINEIDDIEFTVIIGDLGTSGTEQEMKLAEEALDKLNAPYFCVPGNHDFDMRQKNGYAHYDTSFEERQWSEAQTGWVFLGLDTCNGTASNVTIPEERMAWLSDQLEGIKPNQPIALFAHHPFNPNTKNYRVINADDVLALFKNHNLKMVASGHFHGNQIEIHGGTLFTTTACCSSTRANFDGTPEKGFRVYDLEGDIVKHEFIEVPRRV
jgi:3',5'-cyclic AMP phosphodiesterase CpdA